MRVALLALLTACAHRPPPAVAQDVALGLTVVGLALSATGAAVDDPTACLALTVGGAVARAGGDYLSSGGDVLPAVSVDYSGCGLGFAPAPVPHGFAEGVDLALGPVRAVLARVTAAEACELRHGVDAVAVRLAGLVQAVVDELAAPDGVVYLPPTPVEVCP